MSFRADQVFVQRKTKKRLHWIIKAIESPMSVDEMADTFINDVIEDRYPQVKETEKELDDAYEAAEKRLQEALRK